MSHQQAFEDLVAIADWSAGHGNAGCWSLHSLADRWQWHFIRVRRFLVKAERLRYLRRVRRPTGTQIVLLRREWPIDRDTLPRTPVADIRMSEQIALSVVANYFDMAETHVRRILHSRSGRRGRPSRIQTDQDAVSIWLYLMNTSGGFTAHQIHAHNGLARRAIQRLAGVIEDRRDNDPEFEAIITSMEASYQAADAVIRRNSVPARQATI